MAGTTGLAQMLHFVINNGADGIKTETSRRDLTNIIDLSYDLDICQS